jgi:hypothetical protein
VGLKSLKSLNLTNGSPNKNNNKVKSKPLELFELAGKKAGKIVGELEIREDHRIIPKEKRSDLLIFLFQITCPQFLK